MSSPQFPESAEARRVLVVGGTGFVGQHLVARLAESGRAARVLTRNALAAPPALRGERVELVEGNYRDPAALHAALEGVDAVCHLAKGEGRNWQEYLDNDVEPTRQVAEAALRQGVRRFIYVGSIDSYASACPDDRIDGSTTLDPRIERRNHYARSKAACEDMLRTMAREQGLPLVILRLGIVIGAGSSPVHYGVGRFTEWNRLTYWGDGRHKLPFVLVEDAADALVRALDVPAIEERSFLIADAPLLSARDYVAAMQARSGGRVHAAPRAIWRYWLTDLARGLVKTAIRHPNRHLSSLHDWRCRSHRATYDAAQSIAALGWRPAGTREALIERGIYPAVEAML
ncbi:nucleoside-diphosphate-sugar epimerase [Novosphingobium sp. PhB165]|uniref:NAD-dependent epimerase/dehydratase family protein n=1 Tax=Novosphingobium sp. PhB165 TaxID=2485105 RepID=UPI0010D503EE|nr:NAD-dependent epimerase/dehydratase family protein [Novosphingobium sp. PhB165]TCM20500.1 nucleoside-diphosphate-sugar epimerase [Novosphingobium sp. PhB165]